MVLKGNLSSFVEVQRTGPAKRVSLPKGSVSLPRQYIASPKSRGVFQEGEAPEDILQVVRSGIADHGRHPLGSNSFHQRSRHLPPMLALQQQKQQQLELAAKELEERELLNSPEQSCPADSQLQTPEPEEPKQDVFTRFRRASSASPASPKPQDAEVLQDDPNVPAILEAAAGGSDGSDGASDEESSMSSLMTAEPSHTRDPLLCSGELPDIFKRATLVPGPETDSQMSSTSSPFSSLLPLPHRHANTEILQASSALHEEGIRKLRRHEYAQALISMEMAWETMEDELAAADKHIASQFGILDTDSAVPSFSNLETLLSSTKSLAIKQRKKHGTALSLKYEQRKMERIRVEIQYRMSMGCDLTLVYARLKMWEKVHDFCGDILQLWCAIGQIPDFESDEDELRWCQYTVRRAVACVHLGKDHFGRAEAHYADVVKVMPSHRDANSGLRCLRFLMSQMLPAEAYSAMVESMSIN